MLWDANDCWLVQSSAPLTLAGPSPLHQNFLPSLEEVRAGQRTRLGSDKDLELTQNEMGFFFLIYLLILREREQEGQTEGDNLKLHTVRVEPDARLQLMEP